MILNFVLMMYLLKHRNSCLLFSIYIVLCALIRLSLSFLIIHLLSRAFATLVAERLAALTELAVASVHGRTPFF